MLEIGLTGGIACGKSKALCHLRELGAHTIDADQISRELVEPGQPALAEIAAAFGSSYLDAKGRLRRKELGKRIFSDPKARRKLNAILHPRVLEREEELKSRIQAGLDDSSRAVVVVDAALMIEAGSYRKYDYLLVVYCPYRAQLSRILKRDCSTEEEAQNRIESQLPVLEKIRFADYVIETSGPIEETRAQIEFIYREIQLREFGSAI